MLGNQLWGSHYYVSIITAILMFVMPPMSVFGASRLSSSFGVYKPEALKNLKVGCFDSEIKSISLRAESSEECEGQVRIRKMSIIYRSGVSQLFEYPSEGGQRGSPLTVASFHLLPGTKCLSGLSAEVFVDEKASTRCEPHHKVSVTLSR